MTIKEAETLIEKAHSQVIANNPFEESDELHEAYFTTTEFIRLALLTHARIHAQKNGEISRHTLLTILNVAEAAIESLVLPDGTLKASVDNYTKALSDGGYDNELQPL